MPENAVILPIHMWRPGDIVEIGETNLFLDRPEWLFDMDTHSFILFDRGPALVLADEFVRDTHGLDQPAVQVMDMSGRIGWTDARVFDPIIAPRRRTQGRK